MKLVSFFWYLVLLAAAVLLPVVISLSFIDAYEYEVTGSCSDCVILKQWFER